MKVALAKVELSAVAARSIAILESLSKQKKITVAYEAAEMLGGRGPGHGRARVHEPPGQRHQVHPVRGEDHALRPRRGGSHQVLAWPDTGTASRGLPGQGLEKFEQVAGQKRGGTGWPDDTKYFVEAHRGKSGSSPRWQGSQFYFTLPKGSRSTTKARSAWGARERELICPCCWRSPGRRFPPLGRQEAGSRTSCAPATPSPPSPDY